MEGRATRVVLLAWVVGVLFFLFMPIATIVLFAFDRSTVQSWPIQNFTTHWFSVAWDDPAVRSALWLSLKAGVAATFLALVLGSLAAFGVHRYRFFGREAISLFIVLPIALPGIITGLALRSFFTFAGVNLSLLTIVIGHTTFCIVVIYNNVIARVRRTSGSLGEASMDLGANGLQTFR
ncbi:MAG TPA: ABC transporter permease, partial [Acidimicrobiales bacterium]|nr:ABC transporter permease [Acidimicrobiales bacterium]